MSTAYPSTQATPVGCFQTNNKSFNYSGTGEGRHTVDGSHLTLGNRAAISVTAMQIFSEQGRKLLETKG